MDNPLELPVKGSTLERAIINVLNKIVRDMYNEDGTIKFIEKKVDNNKEEQKADHNANVNELINVNDLIIELASEG